MGRDIPPLNIWSLTCHTGDCCYWLPTRLLASSVERKSEVQKGGGIHRKRRHDNSSIFLHNQNQNPLRREKRIGEKRKENREKRMEYVTTLYCFVYSFIFSEERNCYKPSTVQRCVKTGYFGSISLYIWKFLYVFLCVKLLERVLYTLKNKVSCLLPICVYF